MCFSEGLKITLKCSVVQPTLIPCLLNVFVCICSQYEIHSLNLNLFKMHCTIHSVTFQLQKQAFVRHYISNAFLIQVQPKTNVYCSGSSKHEKLEPVVSLFILGYCRNMAV